MEITNEERARIAHAYWDVKVQVIGQDEIFTMDGIVQMFGSPHITFAPRGLEANELDNCQLLLKNLQSISDEDAIEVAKIATAWDCTSPLPVEDVELWIDEVFSGNCALTADYVNGRHMQQLTDFLRSKSYNIGYGSYSPAELVEAGLVKEI